MEKERTWTNAFNKRWTALMLVVLLALCGAVGASKKNQTLQKPKQQTQQKEDQPKTKTAPKKSTTPKSTAKPATKTTPQPPPQPSPKPTEKKPEKSLLESILTPKTPLEKLQEKLDDAEKERNRKKYKDAMSSASEVVATIREREYALRGDGEGGSPAAYAAMEARARKLAAESGAAVPVQRVDMTKPLVFRY
ncbi:MAG: hypothetical protein IJU03_10920 [Thermoguttaceae bacterium]|nr:hypothetical protein [Thermoguttaceae bacterium]